MVTRNSRAHPGATVVDLSNVRAGRLIEGCRQDLEHGHVVVPSASIDSAEAWRKAVRSLARDKGWRVRTGESADGKRVWATRTDLEPSPAQDERNYERIQYLGALITP